MLFINYSYSQSEDCLTDILTSQVNNFNSSCTPNPNYSYSISPTVLESFPEKTINVYFWGINRTDGTSDNKYNTLKLQESMDLLNSEFAEMNLCFELKGYEEINDDNIYFNSAGNLISYVNQNPSKRDLNSVNIYIPYRFTNFDNNLRGFQWSGSNMAVNSYEFNTGIFIHEMGHVFGLAHLHNGFDNSNCENVTRDINDPDYNANCRGDFVTDTGAMPNLNNNTSQIDSNCDYIGIANDCQGTPYVLTDNEIKNYMSYTLQFCRDRFTIGQGIRAREYLNNNSPSYITAPIVDLHSINSPIDIGIEPDELTDVIWESPDIWVRNQQDGFTVQVHQDINYVNDSTPAYVYVKIRNRGCESSSGQDILNLYWAKGGLNQPWPDTWNGTNNVNLPAGLELGNIVGSQSIPSISNGEETILEFPWQPLNPEDFEDNGFTNKPWMFCFLSRIVSPNDPMNTTEGTNAAVNTRNNNNIAYKNTRVINISEAGDIGSITAGNFNIERSLVSDIRFFTNNNNLIWQQSEIRVTLSEDLWDMWQSSGGNSTGVRILDPFTREIYLSGNNSSLDEIVMPAGNWGILTPRINFLIRYANNETYTLNISQSDSSTNEILGGFTYHVTRDNGRDSFRAEGEIVESINNTRIEADNINENATYNWYDEDGNFLSSGETLIINNSTLKDFKLEVIADSDGHKDYKTFTVKEDRNIISISPNPTIDIVTIHYKLGDANSSFLKLTDIHTGQELNYLLDLNSNYKTLDLSSQPSGQYMVNLITDNIIVDSKVLIKN